MIQNHAKGKKNRDGVRKKFDRRKHDMELWDIYDENKQPTGRTMKRNDWHMKPDEFHLTVLGVIMIRLETKTVQESSFNSRSPGSSSSVRSTLSRKRTVFFPERR